MDLKKIHKKSGWHEKDIRNSTLCGCFNCLKIFSPDKIIEWLEEDPKCPRGSGKTAICPFCGIDTVLPDNIIGTELNKELLKKMKRHYC